MIRLTKGAKPKVLVDNAQRWTNELLTQLAEHKPPTETIAGRYRTAGIKDALKHETHGKCAYCESKPLHVAYGDIEHIVPKASSPELTFEWENLTLACDICNTNKGQREGYVDPYLVDPAEQFQWEGPMIWHQHGKLAAERTHIELELNRGALIEKRAERLKVLHSQLDRLMDTEDQAAREFLIHTIIEIETASDKEFAGCVRSWVSGRANAGELAG